MKEKANHFLRVLINVWKKKWSDLFTWSYVWCWKRQMATPVTFVLIKMYSPLIFLVIITNMKKDQSAQQWYLMTWVMVSNFSKENSRSTIQFPSIGVGQGTFMISPNNRVCKIIRTCSMERKPYLKLVCRFSKGAPNLAPYLDAGSGNRYLEWKRLARSWLL